MSFTVEVLIAVHDQDLVLAAEQSGRFANLPGHRWLFLGPRPTDRLPSNAIVARDYQPNHEHQPSFYDFTGWSVLARHGLLRTEGIILLQYDMAVLDQRSIDSCARLLDFNKAGPIAFTPAANGPNWMLLIPGFEAAYRRGLARVGADPDRWPAFDIWPTTAGMAWRTEDLASFMAWFEPLFDEWANELWAGHLAERTIKAWCAEHRIPERYLPGVITHDRIDCHGTGALMDGRHRDWTERASTFGR